MPDQSDSDLPILSSPESRDFIGQFGALVSGFTPFATIVDGRLETSTSGLPLASITVDSEMLPDGGALLPVAYRKDFELAWTLFIDEAVLQADLELEAWVFDVPFYESFPLRLFNRWLPRLHYHIAPVGYREKISDPDNQPEDWLALVGSSRLVDPVGYKGGGWRS